MAATLSRFDVLSLIELLNNIKKPVDKRNYWIVELAQAMSIAIEEKKIPATGEKKDFLPRHLERDAKTKTIYIVP